MSTEDKDRLVRFGIIGTGHMGIEHMLCIQNCEDAEVVAFADPNETSREWGRNMTGSEAREYKDYQDLIADDEVDVVIISTPSNIRLEILREVFQTSKHVLIEKPLCTTMEEAFKIEEAAAKHPGVVWVGMMHRYIPAASRLIEEAHSGRLGQLKMLSMRVHRGPFLQKTNDWNRFNRNTGGSLMEECAHFFDMMNLIMCDRPVRVFASGGQATNHLDESYDGEVPDIIDHAYTIIEFAGGARGMLDLCMFADGTRNQNELALVGDRGKVEWFSPESKVVISGREPGAVETLPIAVEDRILKSDFHEGATYIEYQALLKAVRNGGKVEVTVRDGLMAAAVTIAAQRSIEERRPIELSELGLL